MFLHTARVDEQIVDKQRHRFVVRYHRADEFVEFRWRVGQSKGHPPVSVDFTIESVERRQVS